MKMRSALPPSFAPGSGSASLTRPSSSRVEAWCSHGSTALLPWRRCGATSAWRHCYLREARCYRRTAALLQHVAPKAQRRCCHDGDAVLPGWHGVAARIRWCYQPPARRRSPELRAVDVGRYEWHATPMLRLLGAGGIFSTGEKGRGRSLSR